MGPFARVACAFTIAGLTPFPILPAQGKAATPDFPALLHESFDLDRLWQPVRGGERVLQASSYDRASDAGPADPERWYANGDAGQFLRVEREADGSARHVLCDVEGPAVIERIWSANPAGRLSFWFDGETAPRWTVDFAALLRGAIAPLRPPLCATVSRGGNCFLPIPFAERVVVTCDQGGFYYQVGVRRCAAGSKVPSFDPAWLETHAEAIAATCTWLAASGEVAAARYRPVGVPLEFDGSSSSSWHEDDGRLLRHKIDGSGVIRMFRVALHPNTRRKTPLASPGRALSLRIECDGVRTVDVPLGDFFGCGPDLRAWSSLALEVDGSGNCFCRFPIPFQESCAIGLYADEDLDVDVSLLIATERRAVPDDALQFRAGWSYTKDRRTRPFSDHVVLDATGTGRFAGVTLAVRNPTRAWWGEGDERVWVDDDTFPSVFGTGTEDYFGYAWCCPETFAHPLCAQPRADGPANFGLVSNVRLQIGDAIPFHQRIRFAFEIWHWQDVVVDYATTAYWYATAATTATFPALPDAATRTPPPLAAPPMFIAPGALEGEKLEVLEKTGGKVSEQDLASFGELRWSRDTHLWWVGGKPGDRLVLALPSPAPGRYRIECVFTTARDYGKIRVRINGTQLGEEIDLYSPEVTATAVLTLGETLLRAGDNRLELAITGRNEQALPQHMVGLDWVRLVPIR